jgi:hypothetical protein
LRGQDQEWLRQGQRLPVDRYLPVPHRLEQRGLRARTRAIDLVGQQHMAEDRAAAQRELRAALVVHGDPEQIARQQIARELHARHLGPDRLCQGAGQRGLADARHVFDQDVPTGQEGDRGQLHHTRLALERAFDGAPQLRQTRNPFGINSEGGRRHSWQS